MEPTIERVASWNRAGLADQLEKGRLESVLGIVRLGKDLSAHGPDHRAMPVDQFGDRRFVTVLDESLDQRAIAGLACRMRAREPGNVLNHQIEPAGHVRGLRAKNFPPYIIVRQGDGAIYYFFNNP